MKHIVCLSVVALAFSASLPAFSAPSDSDMGFAGPSRSNLTATQQRVQGTGGERRGDNVFGGADDGESAIMHRSERTQIDSTYFDNRGTNRYLIQRPYREDPSAQSQTKQHDFVGMVKKIKDPVGFGLLAPNSTSDLSFRGPQTLGFGSSKGPSFWAVKNGFMTRATGTGSVKLSVTSANGKD